MDKLTQRPETQQPTRNNRKNNKILSIEVVLYLLLVILASLACTWAERLAGLEPGATTVIPTLAPATRVKPTLSPTQTPGHVITLPTLPPTERPTEAPPSPTPLPSPRPNGDLLLSDTCDGGGATALYGTEYMDFGVEGGQCRIAANASGYVLPALYDYPVLADFIIEFDLTVIAAAPKSSYCAIFRSDDAAEGLDYYYQMCLDPAENKVEFSAWQYTDWAREEIADVAGSALPIGSTVRFRVEGAGPEFRLFLDGNFAAEFVGDEITAPGYFGISISTNSAPESFIFDDLMIYDIP